MEFSSNIALYKLDSEVAQYLQVNTARCYTKTESVRDAILRYSEHT